jgi:formylglycine-generating enzyme required for sulfatase activity
MRAAIFCLACIAMLLATDARCAAKGQTTMSIDTIEKICDFITEREQTAMAVAQRFGMHLVDTPGSEVTFTPRDRDFTHGSAAREWKKETLNDVTLTLAKDALTVGKFREAFGTLRGFVGQHADQPQTFAVVIDRHPDRPNVCSLTASVEGNPSVAHPPADVRITTISIVPGPRFASAPPGKKL